FPPRNAYHGPPTILEATCRPPGDRREHFGFADGISQPILTGSPEAERYPESTHLTEPGEIVLGYPDGAGAIDPGPQLAGVDGFGMNGSYLVFRQLQQNVPAFWRFVNRQATGDQFRYSAASRQLASKIVGRELDGAPIVPYAGGEDNEFDFANDRYGYGGPGGAHIRPANPPGSPAPSRPLATEMNRHGILRRGRPYGDMMEYPFSGKSDEVDDRGLFFLCLNADLERQFEFINQNWVQGTAFAGLPIERDPLVGERSEGCRGF